MSFVHPHTVRDAETDAMGLLRPEAALCVAHDAWESLLREAGMPIDAILAEGKFGLPIVHAEVRPVRAVSARLLHIDVAIEAIGARSLRVACALSDGAGAPLAQILTVHAAIDRATRRPIALPEALIRALEPYRR